ncbi:MAG: sulfurtransferase-like selenium metabolism protein YedF [Deltaproteobacteria bacterium]|nr:sulfurtransferase-like selenium metabolism protein YedF [Deltaproteobacteria bacterium]OQX62158.1 MAG: SirA family protein [Desulfococcus sp. 4484_242]
MIKEIDCRGLACPAPVLQTKEALEKDRPQIIKVVVDNEASKQNVARFLTSRKLDVSIEEVEGEFHITATVGDSAAPAAIVNEQAEGARKKIMVMVTNDCMGHGDDVLGRKLMASFLKTLKEMGDELWRLVFVNNGVKMTIRGSEVLPIIQEHEKAGIYILVCGTCLTHFNLLGEKEVGETTNMLDIVTAMQLADKVITI